MAMTEKELIKRDLERDVWQEALDAVKALSLAKSARYAQSKFQRSLRRGIERAFRSKNSPSF